jgi:two-component system, response regulator PdtaR
MPQGERLRYVSGGSKPPAGRPRPGDDPGTLQPGTGGGERILVVEDDYFVALTLESALTEAGYRVLAVVASGEEALQEVERVRPDLLLMDIRLAGRLDGIETARVLLETGVRSVFASAHSDQGTRERGSTAEPLGWLTKPFTNRQMLAAVADALLRIRPN